MDIRIAADTSLADAIRRAPEILDTYIHGGLMGAAGLFVDAMQKNIRANDSIAYGDLYRSISAVKSERNALAARANVGMVHGAYVEHGVGPGGAGKESVQALRKWMSIRGIGTGDEKEDNRIRFLIARKIHREGIRPKPFAAPARAEKERAARNRVDRAVSEAIAAAGLS